jgi:hypothetical protein
MPKKTEEKSIRNIELHPDTVKEIDRLVSVAEKKGTGTREEFMELFFESFEGDDNQGKSLRKTGIENKSAQKYAAMFANSRMGKKAIRPVYDVYFNVASVRHGTFEDEKTKKKQPLISANGGVILVNRDTNVEADEKLADVVAFSKNIEKIDLIEEGKIYKLQAATPNINPPFLHLEVDERCGSAEVCADKKMTDIAELQLNLYEITTVKEKAENASKSKYDYRMVEVMIESINYKKGQDFAKLTLSDLSLTQKDYEEKKFDAYLQALCNKESVSNLGKESIVRMIGQIDHSVTEQWGEQTTLLFPVMIYPLMIVEPEVYESSTQVNDDDVEDASDYFSKKDESETTTENEEEAEEYFEEKKEEVDKGAPVQEEEKTEEKPDKYESIKNHDCVINDDFGKPEDNLAACNDCEKAEPDVFKLCHEKAKELGN